jgi:hypothetical protein
MPAAFRLLPCWKGYSGSVVRNALSFSCTGTKSQMLSAYQWMFLGNAACLIGIGVDAGSRLLPTHRNPPRSQARCVGQKPDQEPLTHKLRSDDRAASASLQRAAPLIRGHTDFLF